MNMLKKVWPKLLQVHQCTIVTVGEDSRVSVASMC